MTSDTIDKVREAELAADKAEKDAQVQADQIVAGAENEAATLRADLVKTSREAAESAGKKAQEKTDGLLEEARKEAEKSIEELRSSVASGREKAVKAIIEDLTKN